MAGEARITIGIGYSFDSELFRDSDGYFDSSFQYGEHFDSKLLQVIEPFYGVENGRFAVIAVSTARSGDPQEWDYDYGLQSFDSITSDEFAAFAELVDAFQDMYPGTVDSTSSLGPIVSITADI